MVVKEREMTSECMVADGKLVEFLWYLSITVRVVDMHVRGACLWVWLS